VPQTIARAGGAIIAMEILLDHEQDCPVPDGYILVENEVDFLRLATSGQSLLIRGRELCAWAEGFYSLRNLPVRVVESPGIALRRFFPELTNEQAKEIAQKIGKNFVSSDELSPVYILDACFPKDYPLWHGKPSLEHAAHWLLWWLGHHPTPAEKTILEKFASIMEQCAEDETVKSLYQATNAENAKVLLWQWLGAERPFMRDMKEFPVKLPPQWLQELKQVWMKRIVDSQGAFFAEMKFFPLPSDLRQEFAHLAAEYYLKNPHRLDRTVLGDIQLFVSHKIFSELEKHLPPSEPSTLPEEESAVLAWFEKEYFPYRRWQATYGDENSRQIVLKHAHNFIRWLLKHYPLWLLGGENIAYQKSARLTINSSDMVIFCIILDGLPVWDASVLLQEISRVSRLTLLTKSYTFTTLPTVTEFAKEALLRGVPPNFTGQTPFLGETLPDNRSPKRHLRDVQPGQVIFWRVEQPDKAYHFEQEDKREKKIFSELQTIVREIEEVVNTTPDNIHLNIFITSDHGRLMNSHSPRQLPLEEGMQAHGRVAWKSCERAFPETGFVIYEKDGWIELDGERFGMRQNHCFRIAWNESCFNSSNGYEAYPHGGLFPEEVIVPWLVFERDAATPELDISISGEGEANMSSKVFISILNSSRMSLECQEIEISGENYLGKITAHKEIPPLDKVIFQEILAPWPSKIIERNLTAKVTFTLPNGKIYTQNVTPDLKVQILYQQSDDLLKDLL